MKIMKKHFKASFTPPRYECNIREILRHHYNTGHCVGHLWQFRLTNFINNIFVWWWGLFRHVPCACGSSAVRHKQNGGHKHGKLFFHVYIVFIIMARMLCLLHAQSCSKGVWRMQTGYSFIDGTQPADGTILLTLYIWKLVVQKNKTP